jgi:hypothetical protein
MSVKFEKDTISQTSGMAAAGQGLAMVKSSKHPIAHEIGTALTGGKANEGTKGYLAVSCITSRSQKVQFLTRYPVLP